MDRVDLSRHRYMRELEAWNEVRALIEQSTPGETAGICTYIWNTETRYHITHRMARKMCRRLNKLPRGKDTAYCWRYGAKGPRWRWVNRFIRRWDVDVKKWPKKQRKK